MKTIQTQADLDSLQSRALSLVVPKEAVLAVGLGTCGIGNGAQDIYDAIAEKLSRLGEGAPRLKKTGCFGFCAEEPMVSLYRPGKSVLLFGSARKADVTSYIRAAQDQKAADKLASFAYARIDDWDFMNGNYSFGSSYPKTPVWNETSFFKGQTKLVLRDAGLIDPESLDEYIAVGGYAALCKVLTTMDSRAVVEELSASGLRGRGGAGFPTGRKWELMRIQEGAEKWVICNADEGDPGAYMNRNEIESDPHMIIEGMAIGAYAMGARQGFIYIRAEYPLAVQRLNHAIEEARERGFLGEHIFGTDFSFDLEIVQGAGAFVCGEETALIASAEGRAGRSSPRPPFPAQSGFHGAPTTINNVETWSNIPWILSRGAAAFRGIGTERSPGTKVFSLVGKARNTGLVELPLGIPLKDIIYGMGGGAGPHKRVRAVQTGGPSGGCVPADELSVGVDYESLAQLGAIMGSGGMVVMDGETCLVDVARYFTAFTAAESCGKCVPCREGLSQMLHILDAVTRGEAEEKDLDELEALALVVRDSSLCGLGQTAANPVLTTLKYFRDEYLEHIREKRCSAGVCESLFTALCQNSCPLNLNIPGYIQLLKENRIEEAYELTLRGNPLPGTLGRICHFHCQMRCRRETLDEAVAQGEIHRYLADAVAKMGRTKAVWARLAAEKLPPTGKKISIVGAGPAGIMASYFLARLGHELTIYDAHPKAGGVLRYGIPAYRLPREVLDGELGLLSKLGVHFQLSTRIGQDLSFESLREKADAVILAIGAVADRPLGIRGEQLNDVHPGYTLLEALNERRAKAPTGKVLIIGGGNVAIDVARTLIRTGAEVTLAYRRGREDLSANEVEVLGAEEEGVSFLFMVAPEEILGDAEGSVRAVRLVRMAAGPIDASGRSSPIKTKDYFELGCTTVVSAVGEHADIGPLGIKGLAVRTSGSVEVDRFSCKSSLPSVWAIGDLVTGPATAAEAMGIALKAVKAIDLALMGQARMARLEKVFTYRHEAPLEPLGTKMHHSRKLSPEDRRNNFNEITQGYSGEQAIAEAERCLRCDVAECASREGR